MPKTPATKVEAPAATPPEAAPVQSEPIRFDDPISAADQTVVAADNLTDQLISEAQMQALQGEAGREDTKRDFALKVYAARAKKNEPPPAPPPLAPRMTEQTNAEIEAGRKMNAHHAALQVNRPRPDRSNEKHDAVFRPSDYVPDQKKGQGHIQARNL